MIIYDPRGHDFVSWASLVTELFAANQMPYPTPQTDWREWGLSLYGAGVFAQDSTPDPYDFADWQDWAQRLVSIINLQVN